MTHYPICAKRCVLALSISALSHLSYAGGIFVDAQNGMGTGNAFAGSAAVTEGASTVFYNPAAMSYLPQGHSLSMAAGFFQANTDFDNQSSNKVAPIIPLGDNQSTIKRHAVIPAFYYVQSLNRDVYVGLGVSPTYGNDGEWNGGFIGRYQGTHTQITGININPSLSWRLNEQWSLGFGIDYLKMDAEISRKIPLLNGTTYLGDGSLNVNGHDKAWGYNAGLLWQPAPATHIGLSYRSGIKVHLDGTATSPTITAPATTQISLPAMASLALSQKLNASWELLADVTWYDWSKISSIDIYNQNTQGLLLKETLNFQDGLRAGLGANYQASPQWKLRLGSAYDKGVVPDAQNLSVRFPDNDRIWLAFGGSYQLSADQSLDVGYAHIFVPDANINHRTDIKNNPTNQVVVGSFKTKADLLSVQWNMHF